MMKIKQTISSLIYSYNPSEFTPIYKNAKLDNVGTFIAYKLWCVTRFTAQFGFALVLLPVGGIQTTESE